MNTIEAVNRYIDRSKLPDVKGHYEMGGETMRTLIHHAEAEAARTALYDSLFDVISLAYHYGMAAGYRMGTKHKGGTA